MSTIRNPKSIEAVSASLNRTLAGVRQHQVVAAQRELRRRRAAGPARPHLLGPPGRSSEFAERIASRRRTNLMIGTLDRLRRSPATWNTARQRGLSGPG